MSCRLLGRGVHIELVVDHDELRVLSRWSAISDQQVETRWLKTFILD
jgi:hypothetical protein